MESRPTVQDSYFLNKNSRIMNKCKEDFVTYLMSTFNEQNYEAIVVFILY